MLLLLLFYSYCIGWGIFGSSSAPAYNKVSAPSLTSVSYSSVHDILDAVNPTITTATISGASTYTGSAPSYSKPTVSLGTAPTISNLTISAVQPTPPSAPNFSTPSIGAITVSLQHLIILEFHLLIQHLLQQ